MSISKKLFGPIAILAVVCIGLLASSLWVLSAINRVVAEREAVQAQLYTISEIRSLSRSLQRDTHNLIFEPDEAERRIITDKLTERLPAMRTEVDRLLAMLSDADRERLGANYADLQLTVVSELSAIQRLTGELDANQLFDRVRTQVRPAERAASEATDEFDAFKHEEFKRLEAEEDRIRERSELIIVLGGLIGLGIAVFLALRITNRGVVRPLHELETAMERLARGDTSIEVAMTERSDEIGAMARTVATFRTATIERNALQEQQAASMAEQKRLMEEQAALQAQNLAEQQRQLEEARHQEARARQLSALVEAFEQQTARSLATVAESGRHLLSTADLMNHAVEDTNLRTQAVDTASAQASANVQMVAAATEEMTASIEEISRQIMNAKDVVDQVSVEADETTQKMRSLVSVSTQVAQIVGIIGSIAEQTNLLALNATIEAARAGESGRGFAVVASEVKQLADQVAQATKEITGKVEAMQTEANSSAVALDRMGATISRMTEISAVIATAMEEQNATMQEIARNVQHAAGGTEQVAQNIRGVTDAAGSTARAAQDVRSASLSLSQETEALRQGVDAFLRQVRAA
ncbi:MAG TPA: methyl-accepting chemotaxis protein [Pedomonas sp.]|uniref:methyl-accepting chemotaxis protein n=1 Tax=Pedomonas sp. TaxID=2976421 RepID=UPI002F4066D7